MAKSTVPGVKSWNASRLREERTVIGWDSSRNMMRNSEVVQFVDISGRDDFASSHDSICSLFVANLCSGVIKSGNESCFSQEGNRDESDSAGRNKKSRFQ